MEFIYISYVANDRLPIEYFDCFSIFVLDRNDSDNKSLDQSRNLRSNLQHGDNIQGYSQ